jgi:hypothetical protein
MLFRPRTAEGEALGKVAPSERAAPDELASKGAAESAAGTPFPETSPSDDERRRVGQQEIVKVAAQLARRGERHAELDPLHLLGQLGRKERGLDALGELELPLEARLVGGQRLIQPRVLDGDRGLAREQRQDFHVPFRERVDLSGFPDRTRRYNDLSGASAPRARIRRRSPP